MRSHREAVSAITAKAKTPSSAARTRSATTMVARRCQRSTSAPAGRPATSHAAYVAATEIDTPIGLRVKDAAISGTAAMTMPCPAMDTPVEASSRPRPRAVGAWVDCCAAIGSVIR